jgi:hypothetical protein
MKQAALTTGDAHGTEAHIRLLPSGLRQVVARFADGEIDVLAEEAP